MTLEVEVEGRTRTITIERADGAGRYRVTVDGAPCVLDVARVGEYGLSILGRVEDGKRTAAATPEDGRTDGARSVDLQVTPSDVPGTVLVTLGGRTVAAVVNGRHGGHAGEAAHGSGDVVISAPMPGRVVRVLVSPGDEVAARQGIVVVEAMKMENELRTPRPGRVKELMVAPGTSVESGRILAVIE